MHHWSIILQDSKNWVVYRKRKKSGDKLRYQTKDTNTVNTHWFNAFDWISKLFSTTYGRIRHKNILVTNIHQFILWIQNSDTLISRGFHQYQFYSHLCIKNNVRDGEFLLVILYSLTTGQHTQCLGGKRIHDIFRCPESPSGQGKVRISTPAVVVDDTEVPLQKGKTLICLTCQDMAEWGRYTLESSAPKT